MPTLCTPRPRVRGAWLAAALALAPPAVARDGDGERFLPAHPAPAGAWTVAGGNPARTRGTETPAPLAPPELAWTFEPKGRLEGEPLAWGDWIVVVDALTEGERELGLLDRRSGASLGRPIRFRTSRPLAPTLWGDLLVVRAAEDELHSYALGRRGPRRTWRRRAEAPVGPPLLYGDVVYFVEGGTLTAWRVGRSQPLWTDGTRYLGPLALADGRVLGLQQRQQGDWYSIGVDAATGASEEPVPLLRPDGSLGDPEAAVIVGLDGGVYLLLEEPVELGALSTRSLAVLPKHQGAPQDGILYTDAGQITPPAILRGGRLVCREDIGWGRVEDDGIVPLAAGEHHRQLLDVGSPPAVTPAVSYLGGLAVETESLEVRWGLPTEGAMVPVLDGVLVARSDRRALEAWLTAPEPPGPPLDPLAVATDGWSGSDAVALTASGELLRGDAAVARGDSGPELRVGAGRDAAVRALDEVRALATADELVFAADAGGLLDLSAALATDEQRAGLAACVRDLPRSGDADLLGEALALGGAVGLDGGDLDRLERGLSKALDNPKRRRAALAEDLEVKLAALRSLPVRSIWRWLEPLERAPWSAFAASAALRRDLVRAALELDPSFRPARAWIVARVPAEAGAGPSVDAELEVLLDWLAFFDATSRVPVTPILRPTSEGDPNNTPDQVMVGEAGTQWRNDLVGHRSANLLLVSALETPGSMARILEYGELMIETLESWFAPFAVARASRPPIEVHLFGTRAEYLRVCSGGTQHAGLAWTAGHFDPLRDWSRLFMPRGEAGFESALETFLHEVTHHWLQTRCPAFTGTQVRRMSGSQPGYWIVEGFACLAEGLALDTERWTAVPGGRLGNRAPLVASCDPSTLIPWGELFDLRYRSLNALDARPVAPVPVPLKLGYYQQADGRTLFYAQSAAAARYLFEAQDGRHRQALLEYLTAFYTGDVAGLDVEEAFGMEVDELGAAIVAWSRGELERRIGRR